MRFHSSFISQWNSRRLANAEDEMKERQANPGAGESGSLVIKAVIALIALATLYFLSR